MKASPFRIVSCLAGKSKAGGERMSMPIGKTSIAPIIMVIMLSIGLLNHVIIMPLLLGAAGRDAWLSILLCSALLPLWLLIVHRVVQAVRQQPMLAWIESVSGKASRMTVAFIFGVLLVMDIVITSTDTLTWATTTYLPKTPMVVTTSVFLILCGFAAYVGFRTIAIVSGILLPFVVLLGFFVAGANTGRKNYNELFPILEHGWSPVLRGMLIVGGGFAELILFILLQQYANSPFKRKQVLLTGVIISVLCMGRRSRRLPNSVRRRPVSNGTRPFLNGVSYRSANISSISIFLRSTNG
ncbi:hypothetical protein D3H35_04915 [Cohnella faecalis]|uniref:Uncharacterized protein n=2 Tax=Cohnella faecalis TaxID=2315694 RepID=A0A398CQK4_9BACL|nr:hypothetical protein D3H35_04915 [Cohnella faecalis]